MPNSSTKVPDLKDVKDKVQEGAQEAKEMLEQAIEKVGQKADDATAAVWCEQQTLAATRALVRASPNIATTASSTSPAASAEPAMATTASARSPAAS